MELKKLSGLIENEIHGTHSISESTYQEIKSVVESVPNINEPFDIRDNQLVSVMTLNPLAFKLFQYFVATLDHVIPEAKDKVIHHISNIVLIKAYKFFPNYPEIFITYAIRRIINNRNEFLHECMIDKIMNVNNKSTKAGNYLAFLMFVLIVGVIVSIMNKSSEQLQTININKYDKYDNDKQLLANLPGSKQFKKQFKHELKEVKNKLKQKYNID